MGMTAAERAAFLAGLSDKTDEIISRAQKKQNNAVVDGKKEKQDFYDRFMAMPNDVKLDVYKFLTAMGNALAENEDFELTIPEQYSEKTGKSISRTNRMVQAVKDFAKRIGLEKEVPKDAALRTVMQVLDQHNASDTHIPEEVRNAFDNVFGGMKQHTRAAAAPEGDVIGTNEDYNSNVLKIRSIDPRNPNMDGMFKVIQDNDGKSRSAYYILKHTGKTEEVNGKRYAKYDIYQTMSDNTGGRIEKGAKPVSHIAIDMANPEKDVQRIVDVLSPMPDEKTVKGENVRKHGYDEYGKGETSESDKGFNIGGRTVAQLIAQSSKSGDDVKPVAGEKKDAGDSAGTLESTPTYKFKNAKDVFRYCRDHNLAILKPSDEYFNKQIESLPKEKRSKAMPWMFGRIVNATAAVESIRAGTEDGKGTIYAIDKDGSPIEIPVDANNKYEAANVLAAIANTTGNKDNSAEGLRAFTSEGLKEGPEARTLTQKAKEGYAVGDATDAMGRAMTSSMLQRSEAGKKAQNKQTRQTRIERYNIDELNRFKKDMETAYKLKLAGKDPEELSQDEREVVAEGVRSSVAKKWRDNYKEYFKEHGLNEEDAAAKANIFVEPLLKDYTQMVEDDESIATSGFDEGEDEARRRELNNINTEDLVKDAVLTRNAAAANNWLEVGKARGLAVAAKALFKGDDPFSRAMRKAYSDNVDDIIARARQGRPVSFTEAEQLGREARQSTDRYDIAKNNARLLKQTAEKEAEEKRKAMRESGDVVHVQTDSKIGVSPAQKGQQTKSNNASKLFDKVLEAYKDGLPETDKLASTPANGKMFTEDNRRDLQTAVDNKVKVMQAQPEKLAEWADKQGYDSKTVSAIKSFIKKDSTPKVSESTDTSTPRSGAEVSEEEKRRQKARAEHKDATIDTKAVHERQSVRPELNFSEAYNELKNKDSFAKGTKAVDGSTPDESKLKKKTISAAPSSSSDILAMLRKRAQEAKKNTGNKDTPSDSRLKNILGAISNWRY